MKVHNSGIGAYAINTDIIDSVTFSTKIFPQSKSYDICYEQNCNDQFVNDGFLNKKGILGHPNEGFLYTDYISIKHALLIEATVCTNNKAGGGILFYDEKMDYISSICDINNSGVFDNHNYDITISSEEFPSGAQYIRVQAGLYGKRALSVSYGISSDDTVSETKYQNLDNNKILGQNETLSLPLNNIRKNTTLTATLSFSRFEKIVMGRGENNYGGYYLEIDSNAVTLYNYTTEVAKISEFEHNLKIAKDLTVTIDYQYGDYATLIMLSDGNVSSNKVKWWGGGVPFVRNEGKEQIFASLSFVSKDIFMPIWFFADSYFNWKYSMRWPYFLVKQGYTAWMGDHKPGMKSPEAKVCFVNDLVVAKPKFAVWCMGMNDGSDKDVPDKTWMECITFFIETCQSNGITPILCTIPSVPTRNHTKKTEWVRNSGYRYVDVCKAVGADETSAWYEGMLHSDGVHPSETGAEAIARQVLIDFPEITESVIK